MSEPAALADALWRAITYVAVVQLHLDDNVLLAQPLRPEHIKSRPAGHWGTVPGCAWWLSHLAVAQGMDPAGPELVPVIGAGHAGLAQTAFAWLTGALAEVRPAFVRDATGLRALARSFPDMAGLGAEVSPLLPAGRYLGGQLGAALGFAQGVALDVPGRTVVALIGDGECETPTTAAAWLASRALAESGAVLPVVHLNGYRMGGASLLATMDDGELRGYAAGMGWSGEVVTVVDGTADEHRAFHAALLTCLQAVARGDRVVLFFRCTKGWGGPPSLAGRRLAGTARMHKTPLDAARTDPEQLRALEAWLASYRPHELFKTSGRPTGHLATALRTASGLDRQPNQPTSQPAPPPARTRERRPESFREAVGAALREHGAVPDFRVFSPDELASNRLGDLAGEPYVTEVLAEEVLLAWLCGWTATGRRGLLVSYEAFAPLLITGLVQHLKHRRLARAAHTWPSVNLLLTSYGWHNCFTHGDPSLTTALLATEDRAVRVYTPADPARLAAVLDETLSSHDRLNVVVAGKHPTPHYPLETLDEELSRGLAVWPHLSDGGEPDLTLVAAGDLPAMVLAEAAPILRYRLAIRVRVVAVLDLTVLGDPAVWPRGLSDGELDAVFGSLAPVLVATLGHAAAIHGLIAGRWSRPVRVVGWREPAGPMSQGALAAAQGLDVAGIVTAAIDLCQRRVTA